MLHLQHTSHPEYGVHFGSHGKLTTALAFSPNDKVLASGGGDGTIEFWDLAEPLNRLRQTSVMGDRKSETEEGSTTQDGNANKSPWLTSLDDEPGVSDVSSGAPLKSR